MKKLFAMLAVLVLCLGFGGGTVQAEKADWTSPDYNFKAVKHVMVYDMEIAVDVNEVEGRQLLDDAVKASKKLDNYLVSYNDVVRKIEQKTGKKLDTLPAEQRQAILTENLGDFVDLYTEAKLEQYRVSYYIVPAHYETRTREERINVDDGHGHIKTITRTYPVQEWVPDTRVNTAIVEIIFTTHDAKTGKTVNQREEKRVRDSSDDPRGVYGRICKSYFSDLKDKIQD